MPEHSHGRLSGVVVEEVPTHHRFTPVELEAICRVAPDAPITAICSAWRLIVPGWEEMPPGSVNPREWAVPEWQAEDILLALSRHSVEAALEWVNVGPSSFSEERP
jgi:hypothetical protein